MHAGGSTGAHNNQNIPSESVETSHNYALGELRTDASDDHEFARATEAAAPESWFTGYWVSSLPDSSASQQSEDANPFAGDEYFLSGFFGTFFQGVDEWFEPENIGKGDGEEKIPQDDGLESFENEGTSTFDVLSRGSLSIFQGVTDDELDENEAEAKYQDGYGGVEDEELGRIVPLNDTSTEWAVWVQESYAVQKYAFEDEASARLAFAKWHFVRILTRYNHEEAIAGVIFAQTVGMIREAIEQEGNASVTEPAVVSEKGDESNDEELPSYSVHSSDGKTTVTAGEEESDSCWAVWTEEFFEIRRYPFVSEEQARRALDNWLCVRLLTNPQSEVVATRSRWHSSPK